VPLVDLIDESYIVADPATVAAAVRDPRRLAAWWPDLELAVFQDRGAAGLRWTVTGALVGTAEVWLEPWKDGVVVHVYLRVDPTARGSATARWLPRSPAGAQRRAVRESQGRAKAIKAGVWALKDELEGERPAGCAREGPAGARRPAEPPAPPPG
jgi:hypothetical protein